MRRHTSRVAIAAVVLGVSAAGYSYSSYSKWPSVPVTFFVNPANADVTPAAAVSAMQYAMEVWNSAGSSFRFDYGGTATNTATALDYRNVAIFRNVDNGSTIATTYSWWDSSQRLVDSDIVMWDGRFTFYTGTSGCGSVSNSAYIEDIATHEFGHALGLGHSTAGDATMYPSYSYCSQAFRTLASDDIAGVRALYPAADANTPPTVTILAPADGASFLLGANISFTASASDSQDGNLTSQIQWTDNGTAIGSGGLVSRVLSVLGTHVIVARVTDSGGLQASAQVTITITASANAAPSVTITSPANGASFVQNTVVSLTASATDTQDGNLTAQIQWTDNGVNIGSGGSLSRSMTTVGTHTLVARVTDSGGLQASSQITVNVTAAGVTGTLSAVRNASGGMHRVALTWSGVSGVLVDLYRNGTRVTTTSNDGAHNDRPGTKFPTAATYTYRVCSAGTATCTNTVTVSF